MNEARLHPVLVTVRDGFLLHPETFVSRCRDVGMLVEHVIKGIGAVLGRATEESMRLLWDVPGVENIGSDASWSNPLP